jgi:prepilin peptidase CpaA
MSLVWILFAGLSLGAAVTDLTRYRIPNRIVLALLALFAGAAALHFSHVIWLSHLLPAFGCLAITGTVYAFGWMGAGDAKLVPVMALWSGVPALMPLLFWIATSGLILVAILVSSRFAVNSKILRRHIGLNGLPRVLRRNESVPFGVAIAAGALIASASFPNWLWQS